MLPYWFLFGLASALLSTAIPLLQERFKAEGYVLALWNKIIMTAALLPLVLSYGLPTNPVFYIYAALSAVLFAVSDTIYFRAIPVIGSGLLTRLLPASVVITFFLWFAFDPSLIKTYANEPLRSGLIGLIFVLFVYCATHVKKCAVSWQGARLIWFVIFAACIGPVLSKLSMAEAPKEHAAIVFIFVQAAFMMLLMSGMFAIKKTVPISTMIAPTTLKATAAIGIVMIFAVYLKMKSVQLVDNPGFSSMILFTDSLWVLLIYRMTGRKETGNIWASLGIVACAALVVVVKNL